jgi:hypothetical protein
MIKEIFRTDTRTILDVKLSRKPIAPPLSAELSINFTVPVNIRILLA